TDPLKTGTSSESWRCLSSFWEAQCKIDRTNPTIDHNRTDPHKTGTSCEYSGCLSSFGEAQCKIDRTNPTIGKLRKTTRSGTSPGAKITTWSASSQMAPQDLGISPSTRRSRDR